MNPATAPLDLGEAEVVVVTYELAGVRGDELLPAGLHQTIPTLLTITAWRAEGIDMLQLRLSCRAGFRARTLLVGGAVRGAFADELAEGWAYPERRADVGITRRYDRVRVDVVDGSRTVLSVGLDDPRPISPHDIQHIVGLNLGAINGGGKRLIQVEPHLEAMRAERGEPVVAAFDASWFGDARIAPVHPVAATIEVGHLMLPPPRFALRPDVPAWEGTETLAR
ncbi:MAG TPA: hypothetical protein VK461_01910 [Acidimicrobiales bacterium]|nr:hypothetical protein [Acidimicrobiales bacterium]